MSIVAIDVIVKLISIENASASPVTAWQLVKIATHTQIIAKNVTIVGVAYRNARTRMKVTPQAKEIIRWGNRNRLMLRENYRRQFVAYSATQFLAAGTDYDLVKAEAEKIGEPFLMDWMPALTADVNFYGMT